MCYESDSWRGSSSHHSAWEHDFLRRDVAEVASFFATVNRNDIFIHQLAFARRQRRDFSVFESSCRLPTCLPHTVEAPHCFFIAGSQAGKLWMPIFFVFGLSRLGIIRLVEKSPEKKTRLPALETSVLTTNIVLLTGRWTVWATRTISYWFWLGWAQQEQRWRRQRLPISPGNIGQAVVDQGLLNE